MIADKDPIDPEDYQSLIDDLQQSINDKNYYDAINKVNALIRQVGGTQLLSLLDIRAKAYAMTAQYKKAENDAKQMIAKFPDNAEGYFQQGDLYTMYGYQTKAIDAYTEGLQNVQTGSTKRFVQAIENANKKRNNRVDIMKELHDRQCLLLKDMNAFANRLITMDSIRYQRLRRFGEFTPCQLADKIISLLPHNSVAVAMEVSTCWRTRVEECSAVWTNMIVTQQHHPRLINCSVHIPKIKKLTIDTSNDWLRSLYFKYMYKENITDIESLTMTGIATCNLAPFVPRFCNALHKMEHLTCISIEFGNSPAAISLTDIIETCPHVTDLTYIAKTSGKLLLLDTKDMPFKLTRLKLRTPNIDENVIDNVLRGCPQLQELIIDGCNTGIFDSISKHTPKLQVFGYNTNNEIMPPHQIVNDPGLRIFHTKITSGTGMLASFLLPFLYQHMATLENICIHAGNMTVEESEAFSSKFPGFKLKNLRVFKFAAKKITQRLLFDAIQYTNLEDLTIHHVYDTDAMVGTLKTISLSRFSMGRLRHSMPITKLLVSLFTDYAEKPLNSIHFYGTEAITSESLCALAGVAALRHIKFSNLGRLVEIDMITLFKEAQQLESVKLASMSAVTDLVLATLCGCKRLRRIDLENLSSITNNGVTALKGANGYLSVRVHGCPSITLDL